MFVLQHLESIKKELNDVANELSDSPLQGRLLKISDRVETLVLETFSKGQTMNTTQKHEDSQPKDEPTSAEAEEKVDSSEKEQKPADVFLTSPGATSSAKFETSSKIKNVKRNRHERGASRHQRVWSRSSIADFEDPSAPNIMKELKTLHTETSSEEDEGNEENHESELKDEEEVGNPVKVSVTVGSDFHHEENISLLGVKDVTATEEPVVFPAPEKVGFTKEHLRNMSFGGVMQVVGNSNDEEMKVAKQIQEIIGGSKEDLGDLARKLLQVKSSKIDLVKSTAEEITRLRD